VPKVGTALAILIPVLHSMQQPEAIGRRTLRIGVEGKYPEKVLQLEIPPGWPG
jgi:hypothetical protein